VTIGDAQPFERVDAIAAEGAARHGDQYAVRDERHALTYADLDRATDATRDALATLGVRAGHRVLVIGANRVETVVLFLAISRLGAWSVMASDRLAAAEIDAMMAHCTPRLIVHASTDAAGERSADAPSRIAIGTLSTLRIEHRTQDVAPDDETRVASLLYTSGTTGSPKAVMLTHPGFLHIARTQAKVRRYRPGDRVYCALPIAHAGGLASITLGTLAGGGCLQLASRFLPSSLEEALRNDAITVLPGVPALHAKFADWLSEMRRALHAPRLRMVTTASSPLQSSVKASAETLYGLPLQNGYGLTETTALVCQTRIDAPLPDNAVGAPFPGVQVRIATAGGGVASAGEVGEILVQGPNVFLGYYRNEDATRAAFTADGWFATGDLARQHASGDVYIVGRSRDLIKHSSFSVYPVEVESVFEAHPAVAACSVVGRPRAADEEVIAFVALRAGASASSEALAAFAETRLATYKRPALVRVVAELPTLHNGKVDKTTLRRMAAVL
jgi:long-chain acyl-CoA synthetase